MISQEKGDIDNAINHHIKMKLQKRKNASGVLCDKRIHVGFKCKVYHMETSFVMSLSVSQ